MTRLGISNLLLALVAASVVVSALTLRKRRQRLVRGCRLPPGPIPLPFVGNALSIDPRKPWATYTEWAARYGDMFLVRVLNQNMIVINSEKIAKDLFDRRSRLYSDRPYFSTRIPYGWAFHFAFAPYGDRWRSQRRIFHQAFRAEAVPAYYPIQLKKACQLVLDILNTPDNFYGHMQRYSAAVIMSIVYDYDVAPTGEDHLVEQFERGSALAFAGLTPEGASLLEAFPFLLWMPEWFPGASVRRKAAVSADCAVRMVEEPFEHARKREAAGSTASAVALDLLRNIRDPSQLQLYKDTCATAFIAGAETSATTLRSFVLSMLDYPEVQERAQAEIDAVVGQNRLPDFDDRPNLPYIEAILMETLRMYTIVPLGVPHAALVDDVYEDFFIPKGYTLVPNAWGMLHNEDIYPEPEVFKPERFLVDGKLCAKAIDNLAFGFGRRVCPGRYNADSSIWIGMALILATLNISKARNEQGEVIEFEPTFTCGVTMGPELFPCSMKPRFPDTKIRELLSNAA